MTEREALKLALEALKTIDEAMPFPVAKLAQAAIKEALAQPEQEPYCWTWDEWISGGKWRAEYGWEKPERQVTNLQPLYTTSPQRKPLTDEEIATIAKEHIAVGTRSFEEFARRIEAAHGIKGEV